MLTSSSSEPIVVPRLYIGGATPIIDKDIVIYFNNDNSLVVKEKPINTRNIIFLPYPQMANSKDHEGGD